MSAPMDTYGKMNKYENRVFPLLKLQNHSWTWILNLLKRKDIIIIVKIC